MDENRSDKMLGLVLLGITTVAGIWTFWWMFTHG